MKYNELESLKKENFELKWKLQTVYIHFKDIIETEFKDFKINNFNN